MPLPPVAHTLGTPFIELQSVDSTNNYALDQVHAKLAIPGACYFAHDQTAGKGQRGKTWATQKDANITLSIVLNPVFLQTFHQFRLSACIAIAVHDFFSKYSGDQARIKWPNDLYWGDRKAGGILIESVINSDPGGWTVAGIGININQTSFSPEAKNPVSLKQITGKHFDRVQLAKELCAIADHYYKQLEKEGFDSIFNTYNQHLYKKDEQVKLKKQNRIFEAIIKGVSVNGQLIVQHGIEERFDFGEVEWLM